ncbi:hypothetical protein QVD17_27868 [Tagetes erecta]|uniref:Uncharacterized protein n=1 Tax=Tagetes erecta TaxID=13708 RepID=A0AAD8KE14_TARER|nr:hypothetical protein QVD17_27868 [Tagetes erecta]
MHQHQHQHQHLTSNIPISSFTGNPFPTKHIIHKPNSISPQSPISTYIFIKVLLFLTPLFFVQLQICCKNLN